MSNTIRALAVGVSLLALSACVGPLERETTQSETEAETETTTDPSAAAVVSLVDQSRLAYQQGDYTSAIASAERGLRIDRREPEFYLLLAQSYLELAQPAQAEQFAQQGLRHSPPDSPLYQALELIRAQTSQSTGTLRF